jgi:hypothetical protein
MKRVRIKWIDAECQEDRWTDIEEAIESCKASLQPCVTIGFLIYDHPQHVTVALTYGVDSVGPHITIPRGCILEQETYGHEVSGRESEDDH